MIVHAPFQEGALIRRLCASSFPAWAGESIAQTGRSFSSSSSFAPDVTCAIPATSSVAHVRENMARHMGGSPTSKCAAHVAYVEQL